MKLLFMLGYPHVYAGSQIQLLELIKHLPVDYDVQVLLTQEHIVAQKYRANNLKVKIINPGETLNIFGKKIQTYSKFKLLRVFFTDYLRFTQKIIRFLKKEQFDCIHCNDPRSVLLIGLAAKWTKTKMICQLHTEQGINSLFWKIFQRIPSKIAVISKAAFQNLSPSSKKKSVVIYPGVPEIRLTLIELSPIINQIKQKGGILIGIFSTIIPFKGYHHLLSALKSLKGEKWHLISLGGSPEEYAWYQEWIKQLVADHQLEEQITFLGWQSNPYNYMNACDIVVLPSVKEEVLELPDRREQVVGSEGFPTVSLEAMYLGKAIVASNVAGVPEQMVDGEQGLLIEPSNVIALKKALSRLINDQMLRERLGKNGQQKAKKNFSTRSYVNSFQQLYEKH